MYKSSNIKPSEVGVLFAKYSFIVGTLLFIIQYFMRIDMLYMIGLFYVITAVILNTLLLIILLLNLIYPIESRLNIAKAIGLMLLNIPICLLYAHYI